MSGQNPTIHRSRYNIDIPDIDLLSYVFSAHPETSKHKPQYFDAFRPDNNYSLAQAQLLTRRIGLGLRNLGIEDDDKVVLYSNNNLYFPTLLWGVVAAGAVFSAVSETASVTELEGQIKDLGARLLLTSLQGLKVAERAAANAGISKDRIFVFCDPQDEQAVGEQSGAKPWSTFWASEQDLGNWSWKASNDPEYLRNKTVIINYSSGTTGPPKGVEITHRNVVANSSQLVYHRTCHGTTPHATARQARLHRSGERWLAPLPMYHAYGQMYYCVNAPRMDARVYVMSRYDIHTLLLFLDAYRITFLTGVPTLLVQMLKQDASRYNLSALEYALTGSAPLGADIGAEIEQRYLPEGLELKQGWGMTETTCSVSGFTPADGNDSRSVGYLNPNCEAMVVAVEGQSWDDEVKAGTEVGELWVTGDNVMKGYYKRPQQTGETVVEREGRRWLRTGDVAYFDAECRIYIIDRLKELIKVKGLQVSPSELEAAILLHPGVTDVAVVGAKINGGEYPRAYVVKKDANLAAQTVEDIIRNKFSKHKWLTGGVIFINEVPKTGSGKVMRRKLVDMKPQPGSHGIKSRL